MQMLITIIGIIAAIIGVIFIAKPPMQKRVIAFFSHGRRVYMIGLTRTILAIIFLISASACSHPKIVIALGILLLISAITVFAWKYEKLIAFMQWYQQRSIAFMRLAATGVIIFGLVTIYAAIIDYPARTSTAARDTKANIRQITTQTQTPQNQQNLPTDPA